MPERAGHGSKQGHARDETDYYATRPELARLCCLTLRDHYIGHPKTILEPSTILEPGCGAGTWLPGIQETWPEADVLGIERNPDLAEYSRARGFTVEQRDLLEGGLGTYDLIVGNPPYKYADELIPMLLTRLNPGGILAFLLRLNYLEGQERYESFWKVYPATAIYPIVARPGFTPNGATDGTAYGLMCWQMGPDGVVTQKGLTVLRHLDNRLLPFRWDGRPGDKKTGRPDVLDPNFPDPRPKPVLPTLKVVASHG